MSNIPTPEPGDPQWNNPFLNVTGIWCGAGFYDAAFGNSKNFQNQLRDNFVRNYQSSYFMYGNHDWHTWQYVLKEFLTYGLWKGTSCETGIPC